MISTALVKSVPSALATIWAQRPAEPDDAYAAFLEWLDTPAETRGAPPSKYATWARQFEWAQRALAFATECELDAPGAPSPEQQVLGDLTRLVQVEARKLITQAATDPNPTVSLRDLTGLINTLQDLTNKGRAAEAAEPSLDGYSTDELDKIFEARRLLKRGQQK